MMWGPPIANTISGMVRKGPIPTIPMMFVEVAPRRPMRRWSPSPDPALLMVRGRVSRTGPDVAASLVRSSFTPGTLRRPPSPLRLTLRSPQETMRAVPSNCTLRYPNSSWRAAREAGGSGT